jgi:hypothetical protein
VILWAKIKEWVIGFLGLLAAIGGIWLYGRQSGKQAEEKNTQAAKDDAANAKQETKQLEDRHAVDTEVQKLPESEAADVATASPNTAAGRLRTEGWSRD